ncbi:hypothetical protein LXA43DRAFT_423207 [Ganoderma leucocontextum]|nr:hypothetical protein LXA43DRAFT_423207 [Ganoderma leucocontextum]
MAHPVTTILPHPELASTLSKGDAAALRELSDTPQVRAWTRRKVTKYKKYLSALLAIHNSIAPIDKLPTEILQNIFTYVPSEHETWCDTSWMLSLQSVCRRWRAVLLATPEYWVQGMDDVMDLYEHDDESNDLLNLFLARSAPYPFALRMKSASSPDCAGWQVFEDHFDRITVLEVSALEEYVLSDILDAVATRMKRLERIELEVLYDDPSTHGLHQWEAQDLPRLGYLEITSSLFCSATTVPSLHTVILEGEIEMESFPGLLDALEQCPALATFRLHVARMSAPSGQTLDRIVDLRNLRQLDVGGTLSHIYAFLSCLSFSSTTQIHLDVDDFDRQFPNVLPRHHSGLHAAPTIDRLYLHSESKVYQDDLFLSMRGYVRGAERLRLSPAFRFLSASRFLQFLDLFGHCMVTELALNLCDVADDMDGEFWRRVFAAFPHLRRLELRSRTAESSATKRDIAEHFLASFLAPQQAARGISLAWVLSADRSSPSQLEEQLGDVEQVLSSYAQQGARLERLELYVTTLDHRACSTQYCWPPEVVDVTQIWTDGVASRLVTRAYVSRLEAAADVVVVGGGWGFAEDDKPNVDARENEGACGVTTSKDEEARGGNLVGSESSNA